MRLINISRIHNQSNKYCSSIPSVFALSPYHREKLCRLSQLPVRLIAHQYGINARRLCALEANHSRVLSSLGRRTASVKVWNVVSPTVTAWISPFNETLPLVSGSPTPNVTVRIVNVKYCPKFLTSLALQRHLQNMLFYHKSLRGRKTPLPFVPCARKAAILRGQIWLAHESDVVGLEGG